MTNITAANGKEAAYHGVPAEDGYDYAQAIKIGNMIYEIVFKAVLPPADAVNGFVKPSGARA